MPLEIIPGTGIGPVHFGMTPQQVREAFPEKEQYEDWMGGNLNGSFYFHGLLFQFDKCDSSAPLSDARLEAIEVYGRDDATMYGRPINEWDKQSIRERLRKEGHAIEEHGRYLQVTAGKLQLGFGDDGELIWIGIYAFTPLRYD